MELLCINIGNTSAHFGVLRGREVLRSWDVPTRSVVAADSAAREALGAVPGCRGISYSSVVPAATAGLQALLGDLGLGVPVFHLRWDTAPGLGFDYPNPPEVGQDRIANSIAVQALVGPPAIVVDMGTATTFDILTRKGYAGGIIMPGLALMTHYLHEKTALLPLLDRVDLATPASIGKSTVEAMKIGANVGFRGMVREMLPLLLAELEEAGEGTAQVFTTGGNAIVLPEGWWPGARHFPDLGLIGLQEAFSRAHIRD